MYNCSHIKCLIHHTHTFTDVGGLANAWLIVEPRRDAVEVSCPDPLVSVPEGGGAGEPMELVGLATRDPE